MTYKNKTRELENLLLDINEVIEILEKQVKRPTGLFENEKVTDIYNQLLKSYSLKAMILASNNIGFFTNN